MAIQSSFYNTDGTTRTFPSTKHIATKQHVSVYQKRIADNVWVLVAVEDFSLINNSVVFDIAPNSAIYSQIEVRVADTANELLNSPSDIQTVAGSIASINTVAGSISNVNSVGGSIANVNTVGINIADVDVVATNIAKVDTVSSSISSVNTVSTNIASVNTVAGNNTNVTTVAGISSNVTTVAGISSNVTTVAGNNANVTTVATNISNVNNVGSNIGAVTTVNTNIAKVIAVADDLAEPISEIQVVADNISNVNNVGTYISNVNSVATSIVPNLNEILLADTNAQTASTAANSASTSATNAANSATTANLAANRAEGVVIPSTATYSYTQQDWRQSMMSKAELNAVASERRANRAGSGFDEFGRTRTGRVAVNDGIGVIATEANRFTIGDIPTSPSPLAGQTSKTSQPFASVSGVLANLLYIGDSTLNTIYLPPAPTVLPSTVTLTQQQIDSGVIKHADASNSGLIVNGKFDTDTSGWAGHVSTLSLVGGKLRVTNSGGSNGSAYQSFTTVVGKKYIVESAGTIGTSTLYMNARADTITGAELSAVASSTSSYLKLEFTATTTTTVISVRSIGADTTYSDYDNIAVFPADAISRSDLVFLESWHEDVSEKDFVYPLGNIQYLGTTGDAGATVAGAFAGSATYSLFSDTWQADSALVGKGYVWSTLSDANKKAFVANPENNCYLDGDKVIQVRYRMRVVQGAGDNWDNVNPQDVASLNYLRFNNSLRVSAKGKAVSVTLDSGATATDDLFRTQQNLLATYSKDNGYGIFSVNPNVNTYGYEGKCFALPIAMVHRRNKGAYHPVYNSNGTKKASDGNSWYNTAVSFTSIADTVTDTKLNATTGYIGTSTSRPDGLFYDQVHESDILDLRMSSQKVDDYNRLIDREFNKAVAGTTRGSEGEGFIEAKVQTTTGTVATIEVNDGIRYTRGDVIYIYDLTASSVKGRFVITNISTNTLTVDTAFAKLANNYLISGGKTTRTKSNTILESDVIGSPANYPASWKLGGVYINTLHTAEDGTSMLPTGALTTFKLSRKANATPLQVLKSTDSGATWTALTVTTHYSFSTTTNILTMVTAPAVGDLIMVTYQTHTSMATPTVNSEAITFGDVFASKISSLHLIQSLIGKVGASATGIYKNIYSLRNKYTQSAIDTGTSSEFGKPVNDTYTGLTDKFSHNSIALTGSSADRAVKTFPYLTRSNGKAYLNLVFKEMVYDATKDTPSEMIDVTVNTSYAYAVGNYYRFNHVDFGKLNRQIVYCTTAVTDTALNIATLVVLSDGTLISGGAATTAYFKTWDGNGWGDDNKFNIVDNVSTTTDDNGKTVLIGQKKVELPYFISAGE